VQRAPQIARQFPASISVKKINLRTTTTDQKTRNFNYIESQPVQRLSRYNLVKRDNNATNFRRPVMSSTSYGTDYNEYYKLPKSMSRI